MGRAAERRGQTRDALMPGILVHRGFSVATARQFGRRGGCLEGWTLKSHHPISNTRACHLPNQCNNQKVPDRKKTTTEKNGPKKPIVNLLENGGFRPKAPPAGTCRPSAETCSTLAACKCKPRGAPPALELPNASDDVCTTRGGKAFYTVQ